ncbi:hypothetical protein ACFS5N_00190 [Mucilaginibacter ximonensis]|uniref:Ig-like domain-containing protein n=1 Tax=Mucilaginibacter ximonensis TaxID=538021 RepID=A0ABW5Y6E8_9SPHI
MGLNAYIRVQEKEYSTSGSYRIATAKVYAYIVDDFDQPTDGNGATINYSIKENGLLTGLGTASAMGQQVLLFDGVVERDLDNDDGTFSLAYTKVYYLDSIIAIQNPPPPVNSCDLVINSVSVLKPESAPGAADGQISINASSSYLPLQYSLDGVHFQSSYIFTGLGSGLKTVTVKDANTIGCVETHAVTVPVLSSLLVKDPSVNINGNISRWNAAFNPIVFTYQRRDFSVTSVTYDSPTTIQVTVNATLSSLAEGDSIYINAGPYAGVFEIVDLTQNSFIIKTPFTVAQSTGFVNINKLRPYYRLLTYITYADVKTGATQTITSVNRPDNTGLIKADLSNFLQSLLTVKDDSNYSQANFKDNNLSASYQISYAEQWDDPNATNVNSPPVTSNVINIAEPYYVVYAAKQLGERYGGNLAAYVLFANGQPAARWITDFAEPTYSNSYPFDISFIYSENLIGLNIYCELTMLDINRNPLAGSVQDITLLNEDNTWLLNQDGARLLIARQNPTDSILPERLGLNRLLVDTDFSAEARYFNIALKYNDGTAVHTVTQTQTIRIDDAIDEQSVYLRWIGLSGSWNYYRFVYNQEVTLDVQNATIIKNYVSDWENQQGIEEVISKSAGQKMKVMAEDLSVGDIKGLQSIKYSPKVQMLVSKNPVKWQTVVLNTATFSEYETLNGQAPFSVTFNLPSINIQTQ